MAGAVRWLALALAGMTAACGARPDQAQQLASLDNELTGANASAPARQPALRDLIVVDPRALGRSTLPPEPVPAPRPAAVAAEPASLRPAPPAGACPECAAARQALTFGALADRGGAQPGECARTVAYSSAWASRLPAAVPLYPGAQVIEAAGANGAGCALRVVSFRSDAPVQRLLAWYSARAAAAGYAAGHRKDGADDVLGGTRASGGAFLLTVRPRASGADADLMVDAGS